MTTEKKTPSTGKVTKETIIPHMTVLAKGLRIQYIPVDKLVAQENAPREQLKALAKLKRSVKAVGILEPLIVRPHKKTDKFEVVNGNRRLEVLKSLKIQSAPCLIRDIDTKESMQTIFIANSNQVNLARIDMVYIATTLIEAVGQEDAGKMLGLTPRSLEALIKPKETLEGEAGAEAGVPEKSILLDESQTQDYISGNNTSAVFGKALADVGDNITIVGVLGHGTVATVKEVEGGVELTWSLKD